ncbi:DUF572-domain-containing protein [Tilletiaria anomala UBC 951]|uniref:Splicing factor YJU2 n=1 Tax=Tilletiaria anomala (strain ATCC 24038 / CBS 436.72 / UBC 951) TaxID=1037660 RepID=A0A066VH52_TILAU|nr:DUF572-domain-containing protein [Tilletiaria anomala UBC 951]KDN38094.1 DUF572-domain-containing protein [Tilletiaria anomala UBC 951]
MSERKVLNKYFPPDFDPSLIPRRKLEKDKQQVVRLMAPFSMRCNTCGEYVYKGKKFNARKETVQGEEYYGIKIFRFYIKCPQCSAEITFKTDPKNTDYTAEHGASRNFEPWRVTEDQEDKNADPLAHLAEEEEEEELDPMKALEQRTLESKREMEIADMLQDIRTRNARNERLDIDTVTVSLEKGKGRSLNPEAEEQRLAEEEDELLVRKYFAPVLQSDVSPSEDSVETPKDEKRSPSIRKPVMAVKRAISEEPDPASLLSERARAQLVAAKSALPAVKKRKANPFGISKKKT